MVRLVTALLRRIGRAEAELFVAFMMALLRHDWPFNVRELFSVLRRAVALAPPGTVLDVAHLPDELLVPAASRGGEGDSRDDRRRGQAADPLSRRAA